MNRVLCSILIFFGLFVVACSNQEEDNIEKAIEAGKKYKESVYTVEYDEIPQAIANRLAYMRKKGRPYLTDDELERSYINRILENGILIAEKHKVDVSVKDIKFEYLDLPDSTDSKINLEYTITIEIKKDDRHHEEVTFTGRMRVEERDESWRIDWDRDQLPWEYIMEIK